jgi:HNH endonuclease
VKPSERTQLHRTMQDSADFFDIAQTRVQGDGRAGGLYPVVTIAAKGVAEHVIPWSQGGRTGPSNLTNCCAGCNYTRLDASLDAMSVATYRRPPSERDSPGRGG